MTDLWAAKLRGRFGDGWPPADRPVLIAGPTASGKSALAMRSRGRKGASS